METEKQQSNEILLARIDERTKRLEDDFSSIRIQLSSKFVTKEEFVPVKNIVYGMVGLILVAVLSGLVTLLIKGHPV